MGQKNNMGKLSSYIPALKMGHKIYPEDLAGMLGLPHIGNIFYVDANAGSDTANAGKRQNDALATVGVAYGKCVSGNHDVVVIAPSGGTGRTTETTAISWAKRFTHLIGSSAPLAQDTRAGMDFTGTTGTAAGSLSITERGCIFKNLTFAGTDDVNVPVQINGGDYNSFVGCDFKGALNATSGDDTASRALYITGGQENFFVGCTFGQDTIMRSAANATLEFASASSRNVFEDCKFLAAIDAATPVHVLFTGTSAIDRWIEFKNNTFYSFSANDVTAMTACMNLSAQTATGHVLVTGAPFLDLGITDWEATASGRIHMQSYTATANILGLSVKPTVS
jgi:hypothetical protein